MDQQIHPSRASTATTRRGSARRSAGVLLLLLACLVLGAAPGKALAQDREAPAGEAAPGAEPLSAYELRRQISTDETPEAERRRLARVLLRTLREDEAEVQRLLEQLLSNDGALNAKRVLLQELLASEPMPDKAVADTVYRMIEDGVPAEIESLWARVLGRFAIDEIAQGLIDTAQDEEADMSRRRLALLALGEHRQPASAEALIGLIEPGVPEQVRAWAFDALAELSHQPGLGRDLSAWLFWYRTAEHYDPLQWQRMLHQNLLSTVRKGEAFNAQLRERLVQTQGALYRATDEAQRPDLLAEMLGDPMQIVRSLAMDIARQRLEDNGDFGEALRQQLRDRLNDPLPSLRQASATLLGQLIDTQAADIMATRLDDEIETDTDVQQAYLTALTQTPKAQALRPVFEMLSDPKMRGPAAGMLAAARRAGLGDDAYWRLARDQVRQVLDTSPQPAAQLVMLLGLLIESDDKDAWAKIEGWLDVEDERVREAAARAWAGSSRSLAVLAERSDDVVIRPIALKAIAQRGNRTPTLRAVAARRPTEPEDIRLWEQALIALAGRVPPAAVLDAVDGLRGENGETRQVREHMLTASIDRKDKPEKPTRDDLRLLIARAQTRVLTDAPALVVIDYEAALAEPDGLTAQQISNAQRGLVPAYLADRRLDDALAVATLLLAPEGQLVEGASDDPLIDTLIAYAKQAAGQGVKEDASKIVAGIRQLLGEAIPEPRADQLKAIQAEIDRPAVDADPPPAS